jgi:hypothetical protein
MLTRRRVVSLAGALAGVMLLLHGSSIGASADSQNGQGASTLTFDVHFSPFNLTDLGDPGPSPGDLIVFRDALLRDGAPVGDEVGSCVLVDAELTANCTGIVRLDGRGTIAFSFVNAPPPHKVLAVTGGSGAFDTVRGQGTLDEHGDGTGTLVLRLRP